MYLIATVVMVGTIVMLGTLGFRARAPRPLERNRRTATPNEAPHVENGRRTYNVVLITVDTLRFDLGYAGNPRPISPHLDAVSLVT